jgi:hypothetical protein
VGEPPQALRGDRTCPEEGGLHRRASRTHRSHATVTTALPRACPCST